MALTLRELLISLVISYFDDYADRCLEIRNSSIFVVSCNKDCISELGGIQFAFEMFMAVCCSTPSHGPGKGHVYK